MNERDSIVVGVDGSPDSDLALRVADRLAAELDLRLVLVNVVDPVALPYAGVGVLGAAAAGALVADPAEQQRAATALLEASADAAGVEDGDLRVVAGWAAERLAEVADEEAARFVVVGSRGRGAFKAALLGSVSAGVIAVARCPVLVVPHGTEQ